jgi:hypothetical protein
LADHDYFELKDAIEAERGENFVPNHRWSDIRLVELPVRNPKRGDMILGYLFNEATLEEFVEGVMSHSLPIAGPIFYEVSPADRHAKYAARCAGCAEHSKFYAEPNPAITAWARQHRCKTRLELKHIIR